MTCGKGLGELGGISVRGWGWPMNLTLREKSWLLGCFITPSPTSEGVGGGESSKSTGMEATVILLAEVHLRFVCDRSVKSLTPAREPPSRTSSRGIFQNNGRVARTDVRVLAPRLR